MAAKRKYSTASAEQQPLDPSEELMFLCLGGGNEVGRSCHIIQYKGKTVMLDAGMHPAYEGLASLPYYDEFDLSTVDVLLISQYVPCLPKSHSQRWTPDFGVDMGETGDRVNSELCIVALLRLRLLRHGLEHAETGTVHIRINEIFSLHMSIIALAVMSRCSVMLKSSALRLPSIASSLVKPANFRSS